ncbi:murein biosynthesis integral membrane protein MurJ [Brevibacterium album]|uniref:murein biosynthesis integral membrane protein MurJ n=1 Tax=Brevibacterium album TaxID=417948 RepID=UPI000412AF08|nr:lipid II flippase MurJ [Brevibacterium album]
MPRLLRLAASAALLVSLATLAARLFGFIRWIVFSPTVGAGAVGTAYQSANQVPNILYEVVAGGALAGAVVPLLAAPLAARARAGGDAETASRIASALLTWSVTLTLPLAVLVAVLREPLAAALAPADSPEAAGLIAGFLLVFAPQLVLYGIGGVLTGVLQAHRRFLWPAFMPLVSSVVVIGVYAGYAQMRGPGAEAGGDALALLAWGTTAGVAAMTLPLALPVRGTGIRVRPTWRFPEGVAHRAVRLAAAGMSVLLAQQAATLVIMLVSNRVGGSGVFVVFGYVQAVYLLPYAVLAVPVATVAFPKLAALVAERTESAPERAEAGGTEAEPDADAATDAFIAGTTRLVVLLGCAGAAVLAAAAAPLQTFFSVLDVARAESAASLSALGLTVLLIAAAVPGWCLMAWGTRVFYALERSRHATAAAVIGWSLVALAVLAAVPFIAADPARQTLVALGLAHAVGMSAAGISLLVGIARVRGRAALAGLGRTLVVGLAGAAAGGAAGFLTAQLAASGLTALLSGLSPHPAVVAVLAGVCAGLVGLTVVVLTAFAADRRALMQVKQLR